MWYIKRLYIDFIFIETDVLSQVVWLATVNNNVPFNLELPEK